MKRFAFAALGVTPLVLYNLWAFGSITHFSYEVNEVEPIGGASSHLVATMARADVLIEVPDDVTSLKAGADVRTWPL